MTEPGDHRHSAAGSRCGPSGSAHVVVTGRLGLVDANAVGFLHQLQTEYRQVWAAPTRAAYAPVVSLAELRYVLGQMRSVSGATDDLATLPKGATTIQFPSEFVAMARDHLLSRVPEDDECPTTWTVEDLQSRSRPIALLTGCFDLIHAGHVRLIEAASHFDADVVVAALTTQGIRVQPKNRQGDRPFWTMANRAELLQELRVHPKILLFDGPDCLELIDRLRPEIWVKEQRDRDRPIVQRESRLAEDHGARVVWLSDQQRVCSSTAIAEAIMRCEDP